MPKYSQPTPKQINFLVEAGKEFSQSIDLSDFKDLKDAETLPDRMFSFVCDKILKSEDNEIKIELPRFLMFRGYSEFISVSTKASIMALKGM